MAFAREYARIYDSLYSDKDYLGESEFLMQILSNLGCAGGSRILDFGCGTGNHALQLLRRGYEVCGVDASTAMLEGAKSKAQSLGLTARWATRVPSDLTFDAVLCLFAVPNYFVEPGQLEAYLGLFHKSLRPQGVLVLECWNGAAVPFLSRETSEKTVQTPEGPLVRKSRTQVDWIAQKVTVNYEWQMPGASALESYREVHLLRYDTPEQLRERVWRCGFESKKILPAYAWREPTLKDFNLLYVFNKVGQ